MYETNVLTLVSCRAVLMVKLMPPHLEDSFLLYIMDEHILLIANDNLTT